MAAEYEAFSSSVLKCILKVQPGVEAMALAHVQQTFRLLCFTVMLEFYFCGIGTHFFCGSCLVFCNSLGY